MFHDIVVVMMNVKPEPLCLRLRTFVLKSCLPNQTPDLLMTQSILPVIHRQPIKVMKLTRTISRSMNLAKRMTARVISASNRQNRHLKKTPPVPACEVPPGATWNGSTSFHGKVIEKASFLVVVRPVKSQRMRLCQCLGLVIATGASGLSAGILELPLFFSPANPDNVLPSPYSHWRAVADEPVMLYSRLSGDRPGSVRHIADDHPDHQQTIWTLPVGKMVLPVNTTISETSEETGNILLPCDQEPCVARDYGGRVSVWDFAEMTLSGESGTAERENRKVREVVQTRDQNGNIMYQWYDQDGHLHTISEWEFNRRLSMYFQSLLEFLYPEYFGSSIPAGEAGTSGNTGKFAGQRTVRKTPASSDGQPGRHDTSPMGKRQGLLRLYFRYNRSGLPNIIPAIKTISLSHHHQAGPLEEPLKIKSIDC